MRLNKFLKEQAEQMDSGAMNMIPPDAIILDYPEFRQIYTWDCGANALQSVLIYYGQDIREKTVMIQLGTNPDEGTNIESMERGAEYYGIDHEARQNMTIDDLKSYINSGWPTIIALQAYKDKVTNGDDIQSSYKYGWDEGHYVVVIGYDDKKIYFEDPSETRRTFLSYEELNDRWHDMDTDGNKYEHWGMACKGEPSYKHNAITYLESREYKEGDKVKINYGQFKGKTGKFVEYSPSGKFIIIQVGSRKISLDASDIKEESGKMRFKKYIEESHDVWRDPENWQAEPSNSSFKEEMDKGLHIRPDQIVKVVKGPHAGVVGRVYWKAFGKTMTGKSLDTNEAFIAIVDKDRNKYTVSVGDVEMM